MVLDIYGFGYGHQILPCNFLFHKSLKWLKNNKKADLIFEMVAVISSRLVTRCRQPTTVVFFYPGKSDSLGTWHGWCRRPSSIFLKERSFLDLLFSKPHHHVQLGACLNVENGRGSPPRRSCDRALQIFEMT